VPDENTRYVACPECGSIEVRYDVQSGEEDCVDCGATLGLRFAPFTSTEQLDNSLE
jgi:transcription initiation factor TFIIIB Brf1 subunit/transcription initiation factor TFIIB